MWWWWGGCDEELLIEMLKSAYREINMQWFCSQVHLLVGEPGQNTAKLLLEQFIVSHFSCHRWWCIHPHLQTCDQLFIYKYKTVSILAGQYWKVPSTNCKCQMVLASFTSVCQWIVSRFLASPQPQHIASNASGEKEKMALELGCRGRHWQRSNGV